MRTSSIAERFRDFGQARPLTLFAVGLLTTAGTVELVGFLAGDFVNDMLLYLPGIDKVLHFIAFLLIFIVCSRFVRAFLPGLRAGIPLLALAIGVIAAGDEVGQAFSPRRNLELADFVAGMCGLAAGVCWTSRGVGRTWAATGVALALTAAGYIAFDSFSKQRHVNAGVRFERVGDFVSARREYRAALEAGVRTASLYNALGWVEIESGVGDARAAVEFAAKALEMTPDDIDTADTYGWALHNAGRSAEALPYLERAYAANPGMFCIHFHLGEVYLALGDRENAVFHFKLQTERQGTREAKRAKLALETLEGLP
jgi:tetratricopeptide (TPR) repeat protein